MLNVMVGSFGWMYETENNPLALLASHPDGSVSPVEGVVVLASDTTVKPRKREHMYESITVPSPAVRVMRTPTQISHQCMHSKEECVARRLDDHLVSPQCHRERIFSITWVLGHRRAVGSPGNGLQCVKHSQSVAHVRLDKQQQQKWEVPCTA